MRTLSTEIRRSELCTIRENFAPWEIPILQLVHSQPDVQVKGEVDTDRPYPTSAAAEYSRLEQVYGKSEETGLSHVAMVYGSGQGGHIQLGTKIRQYIAEHKARPEPKAPPVETPAMDPQDVIVSDDVIDAFEADQAAKAAGTNVAPVDPLLAS